MNCKMTKMMSAGKVLLVLALVSISEPTLSAEYWLKTAKLNVAMPGGVSVPMWGFAQCEPNNYNECIPASVPGPALVVPPGDTTGLIVHLQNNLPEPVSMIIHGQITAMIPVWTDGTSGSRTLPTQRVRSFTHEAAALVVGGIPSVATYNWPVIKPGTYLYQSGTHPQVQVQMGLYGAMTGDAVVGQVYAGHAYTQTVTMLFSEIDPALHNAVANGTYGTVTGPTSTLNYNPKYFLINGQPFTGSKKTIVDNLNAGQPTLLRFLNAGLQTRVPTISSGYMRLIAEDGNPYPWAANPRSEYSVFLPAAKTVDALLVGQTPTGKKTSYVIYDRRMGLNNDAALDGGMMAYLSFDEVGDPPSISAPAVNTVLAGTQEVPFSYQVLATDPEGGILTYSLDAHPVGMAISSTGLITWKPNSVQAGIQTATIRVTDPTGQFATRTFTVNVAVNVYTPVAVADSYTMVQASILNVAAAGVLTNDTDGDLNPLSATNYSLASTGSVTGNVNGSFTYTPPTPAFVGTATFTYTAFDGAFTSAPATVTVNVIVNRAPVANNDTANAPQRNKNAVYTPVLINVLANDTDPDTVLDPANRINPATVVIVTNPTRRGVVTVDAVTGVVSYTPALNFQGTDSFSYRVRDTLGVISNIATVRVNVR